MWYDSDYSDSRTLGRLRHFTHWRTLICHSHLRTLAAALFFVIAWQFAFMAPAFSESARNWRAGLEITERRGPGIRYLRDGSTSWANVRPGIILYPGDQIRTDSESQAELRLDGAGTVRLREHSTLSIPTGQGNTAKQIRHVNIEGAGWFSTNVPEGRYAITAGAGRITSTRSVFKIETMEGELVSVTCFEGNVVIDSHGDQVVLVNGRQTVFSPRTPPVEPRSSLVPARTLIDLIHRREAALAGAPETLPDDETLRRIRQIEEKEILKEEPFIARVTPGPDQIISGELQVVDVSIGNIRFDGFHDGQTFNRCDKIDGKLVIAGETRATIQPVARVDISLDDGKTWNAAEGTKRFSYAFSPDDGATYHARIRAADKYGGYSDISHRRYAFRYRHISDEQAVQTRFAGFVEHLKTANYLAMRDYVHRDAVFDWDLAQLQLEQNTNFLLFRYTIRRLWIENRKARLEIDWRRSPRDVLNWTTGHTVVELKKCTRDNKWYFSSILMDTGLF